MFAFKGRRGRACTAHRRARHELQAKILKSLKTLREEPSDLEKHGIVRRRSGIFKSGFSDAVELTPDGYKSADR